MVAELDGQVAVVTGAARGIGRAIAVTLARQGADVVIADINLAAGKEFGGELTADSVQAEVEALGRRSVSVEGDLSDREIAEDLVSTTIDRFGRIDILALAAGGAISPADTSSASVSSREDQDIVFGANYTALVNCSQAAAPHMRAAHAGSIITIASVGGMFVSSTGRFAHYNASKAAGINYMRSLAAELGPDGVRVNAVAPGITLTPRVAATAAARNVGTASTVQAIALRRMGTADDIANVVLFLASDLADWVTGQCLAVDGGWGGLLP